MESVGLLNLQHIYFTEEGWIYHKRLREDNKNKNQRWRVSL